MLRRVRHSYQLLDRRGCLVAGGGEVFDDQHPAALACPNLDTISTAEPVEAPAIAAPVVSATDTRTAGKSWQTKQLRTEDGSTP